MCYAALGTVAPGNISVWWWASPVNDLFHNSLTFPHNPGNDV